MTDPNRKLGVLRQCQETIEWLREARRETLTCLWFFRELFADPGEAVRNGKLVLDLMDETFNMLLRGNQLATGILRSLADLEGDDQTFRRLLAAKVEHLEATGARAGRAVRKFAEAVYPDFFDPPTRRERAPAVPGRGLDEAGLFQVRDHLAELEAIIAEEEQQLVDMEGFLSLRARDLELGLRW